MTRGNSAANRPNVVFILADDLGWCDLGVEGSRFYETPHLDRLPPRRDAFCAGLCRLPGVQPTLLELAGLGIPADQAAYLDPGWQPNPDWWGSQIVPESQQPRKTSRS